MIKAKLKLYTSLRSITAGTQTSKFKIRQRNLVIRLPHLVVDGDLRVGVSLVERLDFTEMMFLRQLHHPEQHGDLCWQRLELQLTAETEIDQSVLGPVWLCG